MTLQRVFKGDYEGDLEVYLDWEMEGDTKGDFREDLLSSSGPGQVWFRIQLQFNYLELDSEAGIVTGWRIWAGS